MESNLLKRLGLASRSGCRWLLVKKDFVQGACYSGRRSNSSALVAARQLLENELESIRQAGTFKNERVITSQQAVSVQVQGQLQPLLNFCANNYLGLSVIQLNLVPVKSPST